MLVCTDLSIGARNTDVCKFLSSLLTMCHTFHFPLRSLPLLLWRMAKCSSHHCHRYVEGDRESQERALPFYFYVVFTQGLRNANGAKIDICLLFYIALILMQNAFSYMISCKIGVWFYEAFIAH